MNGTLYITTTIPYVNARPHVGFALELAQADAIARHYRQNGWTVRFQTGTDENAGKNVWKFHAVYWPALLLSAGLELPNVLFVHGFVTEQGRKISKSAGATIDPLALVDAWGADALRYYLLRAIPPFEDGDFSREALSRLYTVELANEWGNLISRLVALCAKCGFRSDALPPADTEPESEALRAAWDRFALDAVAAELRSGIVALNRAIEQAQPWTLIKAHDTPNLYPQLAGWLTEVRRLARGLQPFLPESSLEVLRILAGPSFSPVAPLFPRKQKRSILGLDGHAI